jgi:hypothetical protein
MCTRLLVHLVNCYTYHGSNAGMNSTQLLYYNSKSLSEYTTGNREIIDRDSMMFFRGTIAVNYALIFLIKRASCVQDLCSPYQIITIR